jgi:hypothetical protein
MHLEQSPQQSKNDTKQENDRLFPHPQSPDVSRETERTVQINGGGNHLSVPFLIVILETECLPITS